MTRYRWVILAAGTFAQTSFAAVAIGLPAMAPALRTHYHLSLGRTGVVLAAGGIGTLATMLPWGLAADRIGERAVIVLGQLGAAAALAATAFTGRFATLTAGLVVAGLCGAGIYTGSGRAVMSWFPAHERGLALGIRQTAIPLGGAAGAASLPWLAEAGGTRLAFLVLAGGCVAAAAVAAVWLRRPAPSLDEPATADLRPLRDPRLWLLSGASALYVVAQMAVITFAVLFLHEHRGVAPGAAAGVLAGTNVLAAGARILAGRWSDRIEARLQPLRVLGVAIAAGLVLTAVLVDAPLAVLVPVLVATGTVGMAWNGLSFTAAAELAGAARAGAALGLQQSALAVSGAVVPIAFAAVVQASSWRVAFAAAALAPLAGLAALRQVPEPTGASRPRAERSPGTWATRPGARGTPD